MKRFVRRLAAVSIVLVTSGLAWGAAEPVTPPSDDAAAPASAAGDPGIEALLARIRERSEQLDRRARDLDERERSLAELEAETARTLAEIDALRDAVEQRIAKLEALRGSGIGKLAKVYAAMPPERAAALLEALEPEVATAVVRRMKDRDSAAVLAMMSDATALRVTRGTVLPVADPVVPMVATPDGGGRYR